MIRIMFSTAVMCILMLSGGNFITTAAFAADIHLSWTNATENVDGSLIPQPDVDGTSLVSTTLYWGACFASEPQPPFQEMVVQTSIPGKVESADTIITTPGDWCFVGVHQNAGGGISDWSNVAFRTVVSVPYPPDNLVVQAMTVYYVVQQPNSYFLLPVGTIPNGTECNSLQYVNGFFVVDRALVTWTDSTQPLVVVAQCG